MRVLGRRRASADRREHDAKQSLGGRSTAQDSACQLSADWRLTVMQALAFPPVRLAVESQFAIDLPAVLDEGPHALARCGLTR
jgi:hypothetical protein